jgi:hypothetical protein
MQPATATPRPTPALRLNIEPRTATVTLGEQLTLRAVVRDGEGHLVESNSVRWLPENLFTRIDARAAVFNTASAGTFTVTAYFGDVRARARIFVLVPLQDTQLAASNAPTVSLATQTETTATSAIAPTTTAPSATMLPAQTEPAQVTSTTQAPSTPADTTVATPTPAAPTALPTSTPLPTPTPTTQLQPPDSAAQPTIAAESQ